MIDVVEYALLKSFLKKAGAGSGSGSGSGEGAEGKSAYDIAVENGFSGSEAEWLESLKGESATISIRDDGHIVINGEDTGFNVCDCSRITSDKIQELF